MPASGETKLTRAIADRLVKERRASLLGDRDVCLKCGVSDRTVRDWLRKGLSIGAVEPFISFAEDWERSKISRKEALLAVIDNATKTFKGKNPHTRGDYRAAVWQLERMAPLQFGSAAVIAGRMAGDIDLDELLRDAHAESENLDAVLLAPPVPLLNALRRNIAAVRSILDELEAEDAAQLGG